MVDPITDADISEFSWRVDGPHDLAGDYTLHFPITMNQAGNSFWFGNYGYRQYAPLYYNMPLGKYRVKLTSACGDTDTREITLANPVRYTQQPEIKTYPKSCTSMGAKINFYRYGNVPNNYIRHYIYDM